MSQFAHPTPSFPTRRFQSAAEHYLPGRPPYPPALATRVAARLNLVPPARLLDLGCGPANLSLAFAPYAGEILALDPEPNMLALAAKAAASAPNIEIQPGSSQTLSPEMGKFRAALIGRAFHWMDRAETLASLDQIIEPTGAVVLFDDEHPNLPQNAWRTTTQAILQKYAADDTDRARRKSPDYTPHAAILLASPFAHIETLGILVREQITQDILIHRALSLSSTSAARLGPRTEPMLAELREATAGWAANPPTEIIEWTATIATRPNA